MWDIEVAEDHSYVAQGFINHNSSSDPNLQNIPRYDPKKNLPNIKDFFIPSKPGWVFVAADYSQAELRVSAWQAQDDVAIAMFKAGRDIHNEVACKTFGLPEGAVADDEQRTIAKGINFGVIYGLTGYGLSDQLTNELGIPTTQEQAQAYIDSVLNARPRLRQWMAETIIRAHAQEYVEAVSGRRNYLMQINSGDDEAKRDAERKAINMPIQSWTSDLLLWAALRIMRRVEALGLADQIKIWNLVHDNIVWEMPEELWPRFLREIAIPEMTTFATSLFGFPFLADAKVGRRWGTMSKVCLKCWGVYDTKKCPVCDPQAAKKAG